MAVRSLRPGTVSFTYMATPRLDVIWPTRNNFPYLLLPLLSDLERLQLRGWYTAPKTLQPYNPYTLTALTPLQLLHPYSSYSLYRPYNPYSLRAITPLQPLRPYSPYALTLLQLLHPYGLYSPYNPYSLRAITPLQPLRPYSPYALTPLQHLHPYALTALTPLTLTNLLGKFLKPTVKA